MSESAVRFLDALDTVSESGPLAAMRRTARERFAESGFPTRRLENWRFTDLKPLIDARFQTADTVDPSGLDTLLASIPADADRLVFLNGRFDETRSHVGALPRGAVVGSFARWAESHPVAANAVFETDGGGDKAFLALNAAFFTDGLVVTLPDDTALDRPLHAVFWNDNAAVHLKSLIRLGARASATIIETFGGSGAGWSNAAVTLELGDGARLGRHVLQDEATTAFHTSRLDATIGNSARLDGFLLSVGGRLARQDAVLTLAGDHAYCGYSGAYLLAGNQESTVASVIRHEAPHGACREVFKGCLDDRSHGVFQGKIHVARAAQKTDGYQLNKTILLGERAVMDAKPELEIYADDVKCSHGATVGDLDETALFYLRSRGIDPAMARDMLIEAFIMDAVEQIEDGAARAWLAAAVARKLGDHQR